MVEWLLGIGVWLLLVAAVYFFFRSKFEGVGELFGEETEDEYEDEYEEAGQYDEPVWAEAYGDSREEALGDSEDFLYESAVDARDTWEEEGSWDENAWSEPVWNENPGSENVWNEVFSEEGEDERDGGRRAGRRPGLPGRLAILLTFVGAVYLLLPYYCVKREMTIEAGEKCPVVGAFLNWGNKNASFVSGIDENTVLNRAGDYGVIIRVYGRRVAAVLHVEGTAEPRIATRNVAIFSGGTVKADDFVEEVEGITPVDIRFAEEPDCAPGGINTVLLEIEDEVGNVTTAEALLEVIEDREPPVIHGVGELTMTAGGSVSYKKGVTVTDNYDRDVKLNVDSSAVDVDKPGDYRVIYTAVDSAGNRTSVSTVLHVQPVTVDTVTEEVINREADKLLARILADSMSQYDQAKAIYDWCHSNIAYSDGTPKTDWVQGAYRGLVDRKGDCYVYAATAKCLLTRAGITNMDIEKIPAKSMHYWNLIDIGEGWHHFDACRRKDGSTFFYKTDAELMEYSDAHNKTHNYNRDLYPEIK